MVKLRAVQTLTAAAIVLLFLASTALVVVGNYSIGVAALFSFMNIIGATFPPDVALLDQRSPFILGSVMLGMLGNIAFTITFTAIFYQILSGIDIRYMLMKQKIKGMSGHVVITPINGIGVELAKKLKENKIATVFIDENKSLVRKVQREGMLAIHGNPTNTEVLEEARARDSLALYSLYDDDVKNTFVTIEAKRGNRKMKVVTRIKSLDDIPKMERAGARRIIIPEAAVGIEMGGYLLANS